MNSPCIIQAGTNVNSPAQPSTPVAEEKHSSCSHKATILPANEKHTNIHQSNRKRALESGFDREGEAQGGVVKGEHTPRSTHSGAGVNSRTGKGQKRRLKKCKWLEKKKRMEGCRREEHCNWICTG